MRRPSHKTVGKFVVVATLAFSAFGERRVLAQTLPADVRPNQWAATSVAAILKNGVLSVQSDKLFHGDAKATRSEAVIALAKMARKIESGEWKPGSGKPVSNKVLSIWEKTDWKTQPLRRYALAAVLNRFGDYVVKGLPKPKAGAKRLGASETLEQVSIDLAKTDPAYSSLLYLAKNRMISPKSALLKPDGNPVSGATMSVALRDLAIGLTDRMTEASAEEDGAAPVKPSGKTNP